MKTDDHSDFYDEEVDEDIDELYFDEELINEEPPSKSDKKEYYVKASDLIEEIRKYQESKKAR
jgi:hypothetical protein